MQKYSLIWYIISIEYICILSILYNCKDILYKLNLVMHVYRKYEYLYCTYFFVKKKYVFI